jgi:hypothetical protein
VTATVSTVPLPELRQKYRCASAVQSAVASSPSRTTRYKPPRTWSVARTWPVTARWDDEDLLSRLQSSSPMELWAGEVEFE